MTTLARASDLIGRPVVSIAAGEDVAEVKDVIFERDRHGLMGFTLNKRGFWRGSMSELLPVGNIAAVGADAVMIESDAALAPKDQAPPVLQSSGKSHGVIGAQAMTTGGRALGTVTGVIVSLGHDFEVVGYEIEGPGGSKQPHRLVPVDAQIALSSDTLLLPDEVEAFIRDDLAGFGAAVEEFRRQLGSKNAPPNPDPAHRDEDRS